MKEASVIAINRHRINSDGPGVRTLVALEGCNLGCKYCINQSCTGKGKGRMMTSEEVIQQVMQDDMYFMAAGGGITFGGGEPLLWPEFIAEVIKGCQYDISVAIETSLNVPPENLRCLAGLRCIHYIVDVKDLNRHIYEKYTGKNILPMLENLEWLINNNHYGVKVRVPHIPGFNTDKDIERTKEALTKVFDDFSIEEFDYITDASAFEEAHAFDISRSTCATLKKIRKKIADVNGIEYNPEECHTQGICTGSCEKCEQEYDYIRESLIKKGDSYSDKIELCGVYGEKLPTNEYSGNRKVVNVKHHLDGRVIPSLHHKEFLEWQTNEKNRIWVSKQNMKKLYEKMEKYKKQM